MTFGLSTKFSIWVRFQFPSQRLPDRHNAVELSIDCGDERSKRNHQPIGRIADHIDMTKSNLAVVAA
jgi:hypothetical protein